MEVKEQGLKRVNHIQEKTHLSHTWSLASMMQRYKKDLKQIQFLEKKHIF